VFLKRTDLDIATAVKPLTTVLYNTQLDKPDSHHQYFWRCLLFIPSSI